MGRAKGGADQLLYGDDLRGEYAGPEIEERGPEALSEEDRARALYPLVWDATQELGRVRQRIELGSINTKSDTCHRLAQKLATHRVADKVEELYADWETNTSRELREKLMRSKDIKQRGDLIRIWGTLLRAPDKESRESHIRVHFPHLRKNERDDLHDSLPRPHHLVVSTDSSPKNSIEEGTWRLDPLRTSMMF